jgi:hypothetical protein
MTELEHDRFDYLLVTGLFFLFFAVAFGMVEVAKWIA